MAERFSPASGRGASRPLPRHRRHGIAGRGLAALLLAVSGLSLVSSPAQAATLSTTVEVIADGTSTIDWSPGNLLTPTPNTIHEPGDDIGPNSGPLRNGIVRTLDTTTVEVTYKVNQPPSNGNVVLTVTVDPTGTSPAGTARIADNWGPPACPADSVGPATGPAARTVYTCDFGAVAASDPSVGGTFTIDIVAPMSTPNGSTFRVTSTIADGDSTVTDDSDVVEVSAAPRFDLFKEALGTPQTRNRPNTVVSTGTTGIEQRWAIGFRGAAATDGFGLSELVPSLFTLDDLVSASPAVPVHLVAPSCSTSLSDTNWPAQVPPITADPSRQLGKPTTLSCSQGIATANAPFPPITVTLGGLDWARAATPPDKDQYGNALTAGHQAMVGFFTFSTWTSHDDIDLADGTDDDTGSVLVCNAVEAGGPGAASGTSGGWLPDTGAVSTWDPDDIAGVSNFPTGAQANQLEPVGNNGVCQPEVNFSPTVSGTYFKSPLVPVLNGAGVQATATTVSDIPFLNIGNVPYPQSPPQTQSDKVVLCDKWDNSRFLPASAVSSTVSTSFGAFPVTVEYGAGQWGSAVGGSDPAKWYTQAHSDCSDTADTVTAWTPESQVTFGTTGNIAPFNMVRVFFDAQVPVGNAPQASSVRIRPQWTMIQPAPVGDEFRNYSAAYLPASSQWLTSNCTDETLNNCPDGLVLGESAGQASHWWTVIGGTVDVVKDVVGSHDRDPGDPVTWRVRARGVPSADLNQPNPFPAGGGPTHAVVIRDVLPPGVTYVGPTVGLPPPDAILADTRIAPSSPGFPVTLIADPGFTTLEWDVGDLPWSTTYDIDFTFDTVIDPFADPIRYTNVALGSTPDDPSDYQALNIDIRGDDDFVDVRQGTRAVIDKLVAPIQPSPGSTLTFTLRYGNTSAATFNTMDGIDILPFDGDPRGTVITPGSLTLTGVNVSGHGEVAWVSFVPAGTLDAFNSDPVDGYLDPVVADPVSSPQWPCTLADVTGGLCSGRTLADATAVRFVGTNPSPFLQANEGPFPITLTFAVGLDAASGDTYVNSWANLFEGLETLNYQAQAATLTGTGPALTVKKEARSGQGPWVEAVTVAPGGSVEWRITVTNTGGTPLTGFTFADPAFAGCEAAGAAAAPAQLDPGESFAFTCTDPSVAAGYTNTVTVGGVDPGGHQVEDSDDAQVDVGAAPPKPKPPTLPRTGSDIDRLVSQAVVALAIGLVAVAVADKRRHERRVAFAHWVAHADIDDILRFARDVPRPPAGWFRPGR